MSHDLTPEINNESLDDVKTFYKGEPVWVYRNNGVWEGTVTHSRKGSLMMVYTVTVHHQHAELMGLNTTYTARQLWSRPSERDDLVEQMRQDAKDLMARATYLEEAAVRTDFTRQDRTDEAYVSGGERTGAGVLAGARGV